MNMEAILLQLNSVSKQVWTDSKPVRFDDITPVRVGEIKPIGSKTRTITKETYSKETVHLPKAAYDNLQSQDSIKGRNLEIIGQKENSSDELIGFNDFDVEPFDKSKIIDPGSSGIIETIGGATMILILVEVIVLIIILVVMFFLK